jgi:hypothetical protein
MEIELNCTIKFIMTKLEKIADSFVESYVRDHPIMFYSLDSELQEFLEEIRVGGFIKYK